MNDIICYDNSERQMWTKNGRIHREDGPAYIHINGRKEWWLEGKVHRIDGPAVESSNGEKFWYYYGKFIKCSSQQEFEKLIKLQAFW